MLTRLKNYIVSAITAFVKRNRTYFIVAFLSSCATCSCLAYILVSPPTRTAPTPTAARLLEASNTPARVAVQPTYTSLPTYTPLPTYTVPPVTAVSQSLGATSLPPTETLPTLLPTSGSIPATPSAALMKALRAVPGITYISPDDGLALSTNPKLLLITAYVQPSLANLNTAQRLYAAAYPIVGTPLFLNVEMITGSNKTMLFVWDTDKWSSDTNEIVSDLLEDIQSTATAAAPTPILTRTPRPALVIPPTRLPSIQQAAPAAGSCPNVKATCTQLTSCDQAYACLAAGNSSLDRDKDGIPCETLCGN